MNRFEGENHDLEKYDTPEAEQLGENVEPEIEFPLEQPARDLHEKNPEVLNRLVELRAEFSSVGKEPEVPATPTPAENKTETETIGGKVYNVEYVLKEEIYPTFGYADGNTAQVREDLSPRVQKFVKAHELYHCRDEAKWGGWIGREIRANVMPGLKDPIGLAATIWRTVSDKDRIKFYWDRLRQGY